MTRNQIFGIGVAFIAVFMAIGSLFSDDATNYSRNDRGGWDVEVEVDDDEIVITSTGGSTVVHTRDGKLECERDQKHITVTRKDGSETRIEC